MKEKLGLLITKFIYYLFIKIIFFYYLFRQCYEDQVNIIFFNIIIDFFIKFKKTLFNVANL